MKQLSVRKVFMSFTEGYQSNFLDILDRDPIMIENARLFRQQRMEETEKVQLEKLEKSRIYELEMQKRNETLRAQHLLESDLIYKIRGIHRDTVDMQLELRERVRQAKRKFRS